MRVCVGDQRTERTKDLIISFVSERFTLVNGRYLGMIDIEVSFCFEVNLVEGKDLSVLEAMKERKKEKKTHSISSLFP